MWLLKYLAGVILYMLAEILLEGALEGLCDAVFRYFGAQWRTARILFYSFVGAVFGSLSLLAHSTHFVPDLSIRLVSLFTVPIILGAIMHHVGQRRIHRNSEAHGLESFWPAWGFAVTFGVVRFAFAR